VGWRDSIAGVREGRMSKQQAEPNFSELVKYLFDCERAADPPPDIPPNALMAGLTGTVMGASHYLGIGQVALTFADLGVSCPPFFVFQEPMVSIET
jgi:hypothetical protein